MTWDSSSFLNQSPCTYLCLHQKLNWLHHICVIVSAHIGSTQPKGSAQAIPVLSLHRRGTVRRFFYHYAEQKSPKGPNDRPRKSLVSAKVLHLSVLATVLPGVLGIGYSLRSWLPVGRCDSSDKQQLWIGTDVFSSITFLWTTCQISW